MSKELIERLRADAESTDDIGLCADAAARIEELDRFIKEQDALLQELRPIIVAASEVRKERDALQADNARLREALKTWVKCCELSPTIRTEVAVPLKALAATPAQSLARIRNAVLEEAAKKCDREPHRFLSDYEQGCEDMANNLADEIRAMKEPE